MCEEHLFNAAPFRGQGGNDIGRCRPGKLAASASINREDWGELYAFSHGCPLPLHSINVNKYIRA